MALAVVRYEGFSADAHQFFADLGSNRYFAYAIGDGRRLGGEQGLLKGPSFRSELQGPLPPTAHGRVRFTVPAQHFDRERRHLQLYSFRTPRREGPAVSEPLLVPLRSTFAEEAPMHAYVSPPLHSSALSVDSQPTQGLTYERLQRPLGPAAQALGHADNAPSAYRRAPLTSSLFLGAITNLLPQLLGGLFGGGGTSRGGNAGTSRSESSNGSSQVASPELRQLLEILTQLLAGGGQGASPTVEAQSVRRRSRTYLRALSDPRYSQAQAAPIAALLPMLAPLLERVLTPETISSLIESVSPARLTGTVIEGLQGLANLGIQSHEQDLRHLRELNPGVDDPALDQLLASLSLATHLGEGEVTFLPVRGVSLEFVDAPAHDFGGRQRVVYRHGRPLAFALELRTPRQIPRAGLQITIKDPTSLEILARRRTRLGSVRAGPLPSVPFDPAELSRLEPNQEYLVCATLVWNDTQGRRRGVKKSQLFTLMGAALVDRWGERTALVPLKDNQRLAAFWHKVYESEFSRERARVTLRARYTYALDPLRSMNARSPSQVALREGGRRRMDGRLRSGMDLSLQALNALLPDVFEQRALSEEELEALRDEDFIARQHRVADTQIELYASPGNNAALWIYPELGLHDLLLRVAGEVDADGAVRSFTESVVSFPLPAAAHFVTVSTDSSGQESEGPFAGKRIIQERRVVLAPVELLRRGDADQPREVAHAS